MLLTYTVLLTDTVLLAGASIPGRQHVSLARSIESPNTYLLLVEWDHLDDHMIGFRQSTEYEKWRNLLHHFYEPFPVVEHYQAVL